jgi:hypothetical protein
MADHRHACFDNWPSENHCHICGKAMSVILAEARIAKVLLVLAGLSKAKTEADFYE